MKLAAAEVEIAVTSTLSSGRRGRLFRRPKALVDKPKCVSMRVMHSTRTNVLLFASDPAISSPHVS